MTRLKTVASSLTISLSPMIYLQYSPMFPLKESIDILVDKAFEGDWFNKTHSMQLEKHQLTDLLEIATMNQLFQFNGELYEQTDGVTMGSPTIG